MIIPKSVLANKEEVELVSSYIKMYKSGEPKSAEAK